MPTKFHIIRVGLREGRKPTLVSAPAGYGKTTLVAEWIHALDTRTQAVAWVVLDPADHAPERFFRYLIAAIQRFDDGIREHVQHLLA